jgi:hypothetical protein
MHELKNRQQKIANKIKICLTQFVTSEWVILKSQIKKVE